MTAWRHFLERLPGVLGMKDGHAFALGLTASLPTCEARRRGEMRRVIGAAGVGDRIVVCGKNVADAYAWTSAGAPMFVQFLARDAATDVAADYRWDNMPSAQTELFGLAASRKILDLSGMQQLNFAVEMSGSGTIDPGSIIDLQYSTNIGTPSWTDLNLDLVLTLSTWTESGWVDIPSAARTKALWRVVGEGGDGVDDPVFVSIQLQAR